MRGLLPLCAAALLCGVAAVSPSGRWVAHREPPGIGHLPPLVVSRVGDGQRRTIADVSDFSWGDDTLWYRKAGERIYAYDPSTNGLWSGTPKIARDWGIYSIAAVDAQRVAFTAFRLEGTPDKTVCVMTRPSREARCRAIGSEQAFVEPFSSDAFIVQAGNELRFVSTATLAETQRRSIGAGRTLVAVAPGSGGEMLLVTYDDKEMLHFLITGGAKEAQFDVLPSDRCGMSEHSVFAFHAAETRFTGESWSITVPKSWEGDWAVFTVSRKGLSCAPEFRHLP